MSFTSLLLAFNLAIHLGEAAEYAISSLVRGDEPPNVVGEKSIFNVSKRECAAFCARTAGCNSFNYDRGECGLLKFQDVANDTVLETKAGSNYYYLTEGVAAMPPTSASVESSAAPETTPSDTPTTTSQLRTTTIKRKKSGYVVYKNPELTFDDAYKYCQTYHNRLACIQAKATWTNILKAIQKAGNPPLIWFGLNGTVSSPGSVYNLKWSNGGSQPQSTVFNKWLTGYPAQAECCAEISGSGWKDESCTELRAYICE